MGRFLLFIRNTKPAGAIIFRCPERFLTGHITCPLLPRSICCLSSKRGHPGLVASYLRMRDHSSDLLITFGSLKKEEKF